MCDFRRVFEAIERHCKVDAGYSGTGNVGLLPFQHDDTMQVRC